MNERSENVALTTEAKVCRWAPIEEGSPVYQPGCCGEEWQLDDGCDLYPFCHWCGGKIEEVEAEADEPMDDATRYAMGAM